MKKYLIVVGNPVDGYEFYGTFESPDDAIRYADNNLDYGDHWEVASLKQPLEKSL